MNENIPKDPMILLSYVNLKLRDFYPSLDEMWTLTKTPWSKPLRLLTMPTIRTATGLFN